MPSFVEKPTMVTLRVKIEPSLKKAFIDWQSKFNAMLVTVPGFVSLEFVSPAEPDMHWGVVERFLDPDSAEKWISSDERKVLIQQLNALGKVHEAPEEESKMQGHISEMFITEVKDGYESSFKDWCAKIHQAEAHFPGFRGVYIQSPHKGTRGHWVTMLQFDTVENLDRWLMSSERQTLLEESAGMISSIERNRIVSPYSGWFASIAKTGELPSVWKQTMIVLLVLFPIVALELKYLSPLLSGLNLSLSTFIGNALSVSLISFPMMPLAIKALGWWLVPGDVNRARNTVLGTVLVLFIYAIEIAIFWDFLP